MVARWTFRAYDLTSGALWGSLPVISWTHTEELNGPGSFSATLGAGSDKEARNAIASTLAGRSCIVPFLDGQPLGFAGIVVRPDYPSIVGAGLFSYLDAQTLDDTKSYADVDQHDLVADLVDWVQSHGGNILIDTSQVGLSGITRDRVWFPWEQKNIGEAIRQLSNVINGFDFDLGVELDGGNLVRRLRLWTPRRGRLFDPQSSPIFSSDARRSPLVDIPRAPRDASKAVTHVYALGQELPSTEADPNPNHERILATAVRNDLLDADPAWPRYAVKLELPDVKEVATLQEHADGYAAKYGGAATDKVDLLVDWEHPVWPWHRYGVGDEALISVPEPVAPDIQDVTGRPGARWWPDGLNQIRRITARTWSVDAAGVSLSVQTDGAIDIPDAVPIVTPVSPPVVVDPDPPPTPVPSGDGYIDFSGATSNFVSDSADNASDPTGDITVIVDVAAADWTPSAMATIVGKYISSTNQRSWELRLETSGALSWQWSSNGTAVTPTGGGIATSTNLALAALAAYARVQIAVAHDVVNGSSNTVRFSYNAGAGWLPLGTVTGSDTATTYTTAIFNSTSPVALSGINGGGLRPFSGRVYDVSVRTGISGTDTPGGTEVSGIRKTDIPADNGTTGLAGQTFASGGRTWNVNRSGSTATDVLLVPGGSTPTEPPQDLGGFFLIGVFLQKTDTANLTKWTDRLVNTFVMHDPIGSDPTSWSNAIVAWNTANPTKLLKQIRVPKPTLTNDISGGAPIPSLLAWAHKDEPDLIGSPQVDTSTILANYATWTAVTGHPPVFINVTGRMNSHDNEDYPAAGSFGQTWYKKYFDGADWLCGDRYPANQGSPLTIIGGMLDQIEVWSGALGKPKFSYIECSDYNTSDGNPGPTPAQMRGQIWSAVIHGARGIIYFPQRTVPTYSADAVPAANVSEMITQNSRLTGLAGVLQNPINPAGYSATAPSPMEIGWRNTSTHRYLICLNLSATTRTNQVISLTGFGAASTAEVYGESRTVSVSGSQIIDTFTAYECHIYKVVIA